jgi:Fur family transcriptional regulator, ferric uptake regulator
MTYRTRQREAILSVVRQQNRPLRAREIIELAAELCPGIGEATVFRTLKQEVENETLTRLELPGLPPVYECASAEHHHYFFCRECEQISTMTGCVNGLSKILPRGARMFHHEIIIHGQCADCRSRQSS